MELRSSLLKKSVWGGLLIASIATIGFANAQGWGSQALGRDGDRIMPVAPINEGIVKIQLTPPVTGVTGGAGPINVLPMPINDVSLVPEPATYMLLGVGLLICAQRMRRKRV